MKQIDGGVTAAKGYQAAGVAAGIKYKDKKDMALVFTKTPAAVAGTFTTNVVKAAPVLWDKQVVEAGNPVHAVVLNSGIANACTGDEGKEYNLGMASAAAQACSVRTDEVLTASTGVIGMQLRMEPVREGIKALKDALADTREAARAAAEAIMTTDTSSKECAVTFEVEGTTVSVGGMSKGSGMIHPNMATMLSVITTDAKVEHSLLQEILRGAVSDSFNMISVDRDTSTNDTCLLLANGESGVVVEPDSEACQALKEAVRFVACDLAKQMAGDGEGCTKLLEVTVEHAKTVEEAKILSKSVITSNLVKTAVFGSDANWGRILCALGYAGVDFDPEVVDLTIRTEGEHGSQSLTLVKDGVATDYSEDEASGILRQEAVTVICDMKQGNKTATAWGCDLTYDYVKINGDYRS
ncbi:MAG: bifunctional glutamate N-acetyltransferase/amino-acid acetyltransferase ArgJ [Roseburia sp.]|nr:bifunctional glutamate N-acetyltransferase/amino-acid acetyltransferase ArgJ [Roseburia sp.]